MSGHGRRTGRRLRRHRNPFGHNIPIERPSNSDDRYAFYKDLTHPEDGQVPVRHFHRCVREEIRHPDAASIPYHLVRAVDRVRAIGVTKILSRKTKLEMPVVLNHISFLSGDTESEADSLCQS